MSIHRLLKELNANYSMTQNHIKLNKLGYRVVRMDRQISLRCVRFRKIGSNKDIYLVQPTHGRFVGYKWCTSRELMQLTARIFWNNFNLKHR